MNAHVLCLKKLIWYRLRTIDSEAVQIDFLNSILFLLFAKYLTAFTLTNHFLEKDNFTDNFMHQCGRTKRMIIIQYIMERSLIVFCILYYRTSI